MHCYRALPDTALLLRDRNDFRCHVLNSLCFTLTNFTSMNKNFHRIKVKMNRINRLAEVYAHKDTQRINLGL
jgi:hypothetical protein